jgi:hypothetical protein
MVAMLAPTPISMEPANSATDKAGRIILPHAAATSRTPGSAIRKLYFFSSTETRKRLTGSEARSLTSFDRRWTGIFCSLFSVSVGCVQSWEYESNISRRIFFSSPSVHTVTLSCSSIPRRGFSPVKRKSTSKISPSASYTKRTDLIASPVLLDTLSKQNCSALLLVRSSVVSV